MLPPSPHISDSARERLIAALRDHALVIGDITLTSGRRAKYYVDAKRATLLPDGFMAMGELVAAEAERVGATAVGGTTMGADPIACSALAAGAQVKAFFVRKERKEHGLSRWIEGPPLEPGERCLVVEDVVTTGGSTRETIEALRAAGALVVGAASIIDRSGGRADVGVPRHALATLDVPALAPNACPACQRGEQAVKPGSRKAVTSDK